MCARDLPQPTVIFRAVRWCWQLSVQCWASEPRMHRRMSLADCPSGSVIDVFGAEVRPGSKGEHAQVAELNDKSSHYVAPQDRIPEQIDEREPIASRQKRLHRVGRIEPQQYGRSDEHTDGAKRGTDRRPCQG